MRLLTLILTVLPLLVASAMDDAAPKLPADALRALSTYEQDVAKYKAEHEKNVERCAQAAKQRLAVALDAATKRGDLDGALAIRGEIAKLNGAPQVDAPKNADDKPTAKPADYIGTWSIRVGARQFRWVITADAKVTSYLGDAEFRTGRLRMDRANPLAATMEWADGGSEPIVLLSSTTARYTSKMGDLFVANKQQ